MTMANKTPTAQQPQNGQSTTHAFVDDIEVRRKMLADELAQLELAQVEQAKKREEEKSSRLRKEIDADLALLEDYKANLSIIKESLEYVTDRNEVADLVKSRRKFQKGIDEIEAKLGLTAPHQIGEDSPPSVQPTNRFVLTAIKIALLVAACWLIVLYSGDWIVSKYPNAAIYNEVSFQKVLFAFSVFIGGVVSVIMSMYVFFPGIGKYFNPFNHNELDFFQDFQQLNSWQRNLVSLALFFTLLLAYVLIAGGKLD